ncbi:thioredoxin family protein [Pseudocnuella soli]|uniref:thioredoxin family protein n=1 Tax=Pseudocnuella soli TaxID=2502779 RepID=UPI00104C77A2|nr:thioredoxin family protein [Pseudocnuella soli]
MKKILIVCSFLMAFICAHAQGKTPSAAEVLQPVYAQAAQEGKNVLLIFHASWCGWCHAMDTSLQDKAVKPLIDKNYVTTHLTVYESKDKKALENPGALELLQQNGGGDDQGIPYWLVMDKNGKVLANSQYKPGSNSGCPANEVEVAYFISVLRKTSSLNEDQLKVIEKRFRMNER